MPEIRMSKICFSILKKPDGKACQCFKRDDITLKKRPRKIKVDCGRVDMYRAYLKENKLEYKVDSSLYSKILNLFNKPQNVAYKMTKNMYFKPNLT